MAQTQELLTIERELAAGDGATYRARLRDDAVVVVPGPSLDKRATVEAMDASPGWDEFSLEDESVLPLGPDSALVTYVFRGRRGDADYSAVLSSAYVREDGEWKLAFHQQTPL